MAQRDIPRAFESEDYERRRREALSELAQRRDALFNQLQAIARDQGFAIEMTPSGIVTVPISHGRPLSDEEFQRLSAQDQQELERRSNELQEHIANTLRQVRQIQKEANERVRQLDRDVALFAVGPHLDDLRETYRDQPEVLTYLEQVQHDLVQAADVKQVIAKRKYCSNLIEERIQEMIDNGTIMIDTVGARAAQVNGVSVIDLGGYSFGMPSRITARVSPGRGLVQSIEREIELSGPIHSEGFLILSGYLAGQYSQQYPLSIRATITFEQSYDEVEGDSASSTELYALLSALAGLPLHQGIAVTGSVNQHGEIQAVGGVTPKIEGFFAVCKAKGLTGEQGIIIPAANVPNLMLDEEVIDAVRTGQFHIWAVRTIDEGIELLTGRPVGQRGTDGQYPEETVHRLVEDRVRDYAERLRAFSVDHRTEADGDHGVTDLRDGREKGSREKNSPV